MVTELYGNDPIRDPSKYNQVNSFRQVLYTVMQPKLSPTADSNISNILSRCPELYRDEQKNLTNSLVPTRWREGIDRKVLAPLAVKENTDNILDSNLILNKKRKFPIDDEDLCFNNKRAKLRSSSKSPALDYMKNFNSQPVAVVKLFDVFQEIPISPVKEKPVIKNDYMSFLGLDHANSVKEINVPELKITTKLTNFTSIPFSSDYGKRLLSKRPPIPDEVALKKIERVERYLKDDSPPVKDDVSDYSSIITYVHKKNIHYHNYSFPKRQYHEKLGSWTQNFYLKLCKPLSVKVENSDLNTMLQKTKDSLKINNSNKTINSNSEEDQTNLLTVDCAIIHKNVFNCNLGSDDIKVIPPLEEILNNCSDTLDQQNILDTSSDYVCTPEESVKKKGLPHRRSARLHSVVAKA